MTCALCKQRPANPANHYEVVLTAGTPMGPGDILGQDTRITFDVCNPCQVRISTEIWTSPHISASMVVT